MRSGTPVNASGTGNIHFAVGLSATLVFAVFFAVGSANAVSDGVPETPEQLAIAAFDWFETYRDARSGLVPDRAPNRVVSGSLPPRELCCSIASVGYYLSLLPDAVSRKRLAEGDARSRALQVLTFLEKRADHRHGLLFHFIDLKSGQRYFECEYSALDTAILLNGCMVVSAHFRHEVAEVADRLIDRVDWSQYLLPGSDGKPATLSMGWKPGTGLLSSMDIRSSEFAMPYLLAIGAAERPIAPELWSGLRVDRGPAGNGGGVLLNPSHGLFTAYYGLGWHSQEFCSATGMSDLWHNAGNSTRANRTFCAAEQSVTYSNENGSWWGISAGDSPDGYFAPGLVAGSGKGTVWPTTAVAALPWDETQIRNDLKVWRSSRVWKKVAGPYGIAPFNLERDWVGEDLIGIDVGSLAVNVVNQTNQSVWKAWQQHAVARRAMARIAAEQTQRR